MDLKLNKRRNQRKVRCNTNNTKHRSKRKQTRQRREGKILGNEVRGRKWRRLNKRKDQERKGKEYRNAEESDKKNNAE